MMIKNVGWKRYLMTPVVLPLFALRWTAWKISDAMMPIRDAFETTGFWADEVIGHLARKTAK